MKLRVFIQHPTSGEGITRHRWWRVAPQREPPTWEGRLGLGKDETTKRGVWWLAIGPINWIRVDAIIPKLKTLYNCITLWALWTALKKSSISGNNETSLQTLPSITLMGFKAVFLTSNVSSVKIWSDSRSQISVQSSFISSRSPALLCQHCNFSWIFVSPCKAPPKSLFWTRCV